MNYKLFGKHYHFAEASVDNDMMWLGVACQCVVCAIVLVCRFIVLMCLCAGVLCYCVGM